MKRDLWDLDLDRRRSWERKRRSFWLIVSWILIPALFWGVVLWRLCR
jgi:hypothetical protein